MSNYSSRKGRYPCHIDSWELKYERLLWLHFKKCNVKLSDRIIILSITLNSRFLIGRWSKFTHLSAKLLMKSKVFNLHRNLNHQLKSVNRTTNGSSPSLPRFSRSWRIELEFDNKRCPLGYFTLFLSRSLLYIFAYHVHLN